MRGFIPLVLALVCNASFGADDELSGNNVYQLTLMAEHADTQMFVCIDGECQKSLGHEPSAGGYLYDFGTFPVPNPEKIDLKVWRQWQEPRRIRLAPEYGAEDCSISTCGRFRFVKVQGPPTSTTDSCALGLSSCRPSIR